MEMPRNFYIELDLASCPTAKVEIVDSSGVPLTAHENPSRVRISVNTLDEHMGFLKALDKFQSDLLRFDATKHGSAGASISILPDEYAAKLALRPTAGSNT